MKGPRLVVCSVFSGSEHDEFWYKLQYHQLEHTVDAFDHVVYLGHRADTKLFRRSQIVGQSTTTTRGAAEHLEGLHALSTYCQAQSYERYLLLDSDAFPVMCGWQEILQQLIIRFEKDYAAAVRLENLDVFPHPAVVYTDRPETLKFGMETANTLYGTTVRDIQCLAKNHLPLIRTNAASIHPLLASIYLGLFYHHGCGSRLFSMRAGRTGYYDHLLPYAPSPDDLLEQLMADPAKFLSHLIQAAM